MVLELQHPETQSLHAWPWRIGLVVESPSLISEIMQSLSAINAACEFRVEPGEEPFEIARIVERQKPDLLFVELARISGPARQWIELIRSGGDTLIAAVHTSPAPDEMIAALRAGACEFIHHPVRPSIFDTMARLGDLMEARRTLAVEPGTVIGILSAKGGCGATTLACHVAAASAGRILVADLDHQAPAAHRVFRTHPRRYAADAFDSARRLTPGTWPEFVRPIGDRLDLLAGTESSANASPDAWRIDNLFRFVTRQYARILVDLGRNLNPFNWSFLQSVDELIVVTAPDVLALYQTRQILQTLSNRGFDRSRVRLVLNRNHAAPQDFWVESIEQMFEFRVLEVIPNDYGTINNLPRDRFEFPANSQFGRCMTRLADKLAQKKPAEPGRVS